MQTRRDQLQAYRYLLRRVLAAMLGADPEGPEQPMRRVVAATFSGVLVAVLAAAGVGLYGWLAGGSATSWQRPGTLIVEDETGTRYLYLDHVLHRVVNYTSARLILGAEPAIENVSRDSLAGVRHGAALGILGAPDSLPGRDSVRSEPWAVCSRLAGPRGREVPRVDVLAGISPEHIGGRPVRRRAVVVTAADQRYLVWHGKRLQASDEALRSLRLAGTASLPVGAAWLDALPAGRPLAPPLTPEPQRPGTPVGGRQTYVGEVFRAQNVGTGEQYFVMLDDGLAPIKETEAALILGQGTQRAATEVGIADVNNAAQSTRQVTSPDVPPRPPAAVPLAPDSRTPVCAWYGGGAGSRVTTGGRLPTGVEDQPGGTTVGAAADGVQVAPGTVAIVGLRPAPGVRPTEFFCVTDAGVKYPVASRDTLGLLGYAGVDPVAVPGRILGLVPLGPALDPDAARRPAPVRPGPPPR